MGSFGRRGGGGSYAGVGAGGYGGGVGHGGEEETTVRYGKIPQRQPRRYKTVKRRSFHELTSLLYVRTDRGFVSSTLSSIDDCDCIID